MANDWMGVISYEIMDAPPQPDYSLPEDTQGRDIRLTTDTHDLLFYKNDIVLVGGIDYLIQKLKIRLLFFFEEWFLDTTVGVNYYDVLFIKDPDLNAVDNMVKATIATTEGVTEILEYSSSFTPETRTFDVSFKINTIYGELSFQEPLTL